MRRAWLVIALLGALASPATATNATTFTRQLTLRWPAKVGAETARLVAINVGQQRILSVRATFPNGAVVAPSAFDNIVDCAHRGPSFAKLSVTRLDMTAWVVVVLQTGLCSPGPTVAGHPVTVTLTIRTA